MELGSGAFPGSEAQQHVQVHADGERPFGGPLGKDGVDDHESTVAG